MIMIDIDARLIAKIDLISLVKGGDSTHAKLHHSKWVQKPPRPKYKPNSLNNLSHSSLTQNPRDLFSGVRLRFDMHSGH